MIDAVKRFARSCGYDSAKPSKTKWNEYDVYEPIYSKSGVAFTGYPYVILVKGKEIRMSTEEESLKILSIMYPNEETEEE
jgi:hypothetical protein